MGSQSIVRTLSVIMKAFAAVLATLLVASATSKNIPNVNKINACPGHENDVIQLVSGNLPDTINIPGSVTLNMETKITAALPMDLISELSLKKMDPLPSACALPERVRLLPLRRVHGDEPAVQVRRPSVRLPTPARKLQVRQRGPQPARPGRCPRHTDGGTLHWPDELLLQGCPRHNPWVLRNGL